MIWEDVVIVINSLSLFIVYIISVRVKFIKYLYKIAPPFLFQWINVVFRLSDIVISLAAAQSKFRPSMKIKFVQTSLSFAIVEL